MDYREDGGSKLTPDGGNSLQSNGHDFISQKINAHQQILRFVAKGRHDDDDDDDDEEQYPHAFLSSALD